MTNLASQLRLGSAGIALAAALGATPAFAQGTTPPAADPAAAQEEQAVVVTGSRIRRDPLDQDQPVVFVDRADLDRTGLTSTAEALQRLPGSGGALNSRFNNSGNFGNPPDGGGVGAGAAEVDLRYLGSRRILVLVDGLRYVNGASASGVPGSVDLNSIPEGMIERVEVLQGGASAIYGSDAIAGRGQHHHPAATGRTGRLGAARRVRRRRRLHPELFAELGRRHERRPHPNRHRRQLREAGRGQLGRPKHLALPDPGADRLRRDLQLGHAQRPLHPGRFRSSGRSDADRAGDRPRADARGLS